jgi:hypothetical protein
LLQRGTRFTLRVEWKIASAQPEMSTKLGPRAIALGTTAPHRRAIGPRTIQHAEHGRMDVTLRCFASLLPMANVGGGHSRSLWIAAGSIAPMAGSFFTLDASEKCAIYAVAILTAGVFVKCFLAILSEVLDES